MYMYACEHTHTPSLLEHRHQEIKYTDSPESQIHFHKVHEPTLVYFKTYYKTTIIEKIVWYWWKNRQIDSWDKNRINKQNNIDAVNWLLTKERKQHNGAERVFQQMVQKQLEQMVQKDELRLISYTL